MSKSIVKRTALWYQDFSSYPDHDNVRNIMTACPWRNGWQNEDFEGKLGNFLTIEDGQGWWAYDLETGIFEYIHKDSSEEQFIGADDGLYYGHDEAQELIETHFRRYYNR